MHANRMTSRHSRAVLDSTVDDVVREQARVGIDIVNDGEFSRTSYADYVRESSGRLRNEGLAETRRVRRRPGDERQSYARLRARTRAVRRVPSDVAGRRSNDVDAGRAARQFLADDPTLVPVCTGPISYSGAG